MAGLAGTSCVALAGLVSVGGAADCLCATPTGTGTMISLISEPALDCTREVVLEAVLDEDGVEGFT